MKKIILSIASTLLIIFVLAQAKKAKRVKPEKTAVAPQSDYLYTVPPGWTTTNYPDGIVLSSPISNTGEKCNITLWPFRSPADSLQTDAILLFNKVFTGFEIRAGSTPGSFTKGWSPEGWPYYIIKSPIAMRGGDYQTIFGFVFVARAGDRVAAISGISKDPLVSSCFGLNLANVWPPFFYSLRLRNNTISTARDSLRQRMTGVWTSVTGSSGDRYVFSANGRYANAAAAQRYVRVSYTELLRITDASFGNGGYTTQGYQLTLKDDDASAEPRRGWYRLEQESKDGGRSWKDKLYILQRSVVDGSQYEICYDRQTQ